MQWNPAPKIEANKWYRIFAWFPLKTYEEKWVWLEHIWMRYTSLNFNNRFRVDYSCAKTPPVFVGD